MARSFLRDQAKREYAFILSGAGLVTLIAGALMTLPLFAALSIPDQFAFAHAFIVPALILMILGLILWRYFRSRSNGPFSEREGGMIVLLVCAIVIPLSAWPFMVIMDLPFSRALFEAVSGWTTTGLSIMDVTEASPLILIWRSVTQFAGGAGFAIIVVAAIIDPKGLEFDFIEDRVDPLVSRLKRSVRIVLILYCSYALAGIIAYSLAGMSLFDAINQAFSAVSTGGYSTRAESIGYWDSAVIESITLALMVLGNLSFVTAWFLFRGKFHDALRNGETRLQAIVIPLSIAILFLLTSRSVYPQLGKSIRVSIFETISAITTTGLSTVSHARWNAFGITLLIVLMMIGGGARSTAGGIKQFRIFLLVKLVYWEIKRTISSPNAVLVRPIWSGSRKVLVDDERIQRLVVFVTLYLFAYSVGVLLLCANGFPLEASLFEFASALGTVGLSVGITSAGMPDNALWAEIIGMFLGRFEIIMIILSLLKLKKDTGIMASSLQRRKG